jgi:hypothetical protein
VRLIADALNMLRGLFDGHVTWIQGEVAWAEREYEIRLRTFGSSRWWK